MNIALTGITGMVGAHLIKRLVKPNPDGSANNIKALIRETSIVEHLKPFEDVDYIIGDLDDKESLNRLVSDAEMVIHLAHFPGPVETPDALVKTNVNGSYDLLEAARAARVKQFVFLSACAVFGEILPEVNADHPLNEDHPVRPGTLYGAIKSAIEAFCFLAQRTHAMEVTILRPVTIYGIRPEINKSEWFKTIDYLATNYNVDLQGSTKYVAVDTVCEAICRVLGNREAAGKIYHLVDGHIHNLELGELIAEVVDSFGEAQGTKGQEGVPMDNRAARELGVEFPGKEGIKNYVKLVHQLQIEYGGERQITQW